MHLIVREGRDLDETAVADDLGLPPADVVFLSFSDSDLAAITAAWQAMDAETRPSLRVAPLFRLRHPMSVDMFCDTTLRGTKAVIVRLLGGLDYWRYGGEQLGRVCRERGIALAIVPGDFRPDLRLTALSTVSPDDLGRLEALFDCGGVANFETALRAVMERVYGGAAPVPDPVQLPNFGVYRQLQIASPATSDAGQSRSSAIVFYRSYVLAADVAPIDALIEALAQNNVAVTALFVSSLKAPDAAQWLREQVQELQPSVIINATAFAARDGDDGASPLDVAGCTVLQVAMLGPPKSVWEASPRGLNAADVAMHVVLPELDGRIFAGVISFKESVGGAVTFGCDTVRHVPFGEGIVHVASLAANYAKLKTTPRAERRNALVLSTYPGRPDQIAHAVGLDGLQSALAVASRLKAEGYAIDSVPADVRALVSAIDPINAAHVSLEVYKSYFEHLPKSFQDSVTSAWGAPEDDVSVQPFYRGLHQSHGFAFQSIQLGALTIALQPERGRVADRKASYHDPATPPRHSYVAFYLWLRFVQRVDALIHLGAHGTLEWLPGKAVGLSDHCAPQALIGTTPVIYPFIVNDPGEAAQAKRRISAVTLGHKPPPLIPGELSAALLDVERLTDEFSSADGLDPRRRKALTSEIIDAAMRAGIADSIGLTPGMPINDALTRIDAFLCDVKELSLRDGLHVLDREELDAIVTALSGGFIAPGPSGAPSRGRSDVLPTGRNMVTLDPRGLPTPMSWTNGQRTAEAIIERYVSDHGDYPRAIVMDLWGSATLRTGGEELATALALLGVRPVWDTRSFRVTGLESNPIAVIGRPRVDVTLRISGLFRDIFSMQLSLFESAVDLVAGLKETISDNPLSGTDAVSRNRIFGPASGTFGAGVMAAIDSGDWQSSDDLGRSYLAASSQAYRHGGSAVEGGEHFAARVTNADAFVHLQDHREIDLLTGGDFAAHEGGFAAAAKATNNERIAVYHGDTSAPDQPKIRTLNEECARVVHGRAANPRWIEGQMRHGFRGAAEMAASVDAAFAFAATAKAVDSGGFERLYAAYLGDPAVAAFIEHENPAAIEAMKKRFDEAIVRGLWQPRRNDMRLAHVDREAAE